MTRSLLIAALGGFALLATTTSGMSMFSAAEPVLGHPWAGYQEGYGTPHPRTISNGGDPTGLVGRIRWRRWGQSHAIGHGISTYVWPGTGVSSNGPTSGARVVAFKLGTCKGRRSYNAVEWYFPKYDETFDPEHYIDACTGAYAGAPIRYLRCRNVSLLDTSGTATEIEAAAMSCRRARTLISNAPVARHVRAGGRFIHADFRCGTQGRTTVGWVLFECQLGPRDVLFDVTS